MKIVVTGGRDYGVVPDWTGKPAPHLYTKVVTDGLEETIERDNPEYVKACEKAAHERRLFNDVLWFWFSNHANYSMEIAQGGAPGADGLARDFCGIHSIPCRTFEADWKGLGKLAGPVRNSRMLEEFAPDFVIAFPGGKGTESCIRYAKRRKIPVVRVRP